MTAPRFTAQGKQVIRDGEHYADACDGAAADMIVTVLNAGWQDIATAPRAGDPFLVIDQFGDYDIARWHHDHVCGENFGSHPFTEWMPLPDAPTPSPSVTRGGE